MSFVDSHRGERDRLGRPLRGDVSSAYPQVPEHPDISDSDAWNQAMDYLQQGLPFHVHEICEQRWRCAPLESKDAWRALAQWGAALTQAARGNEIGAQTLAQRAFENLTQANCVPAIIDRDLVITTLKSLLA